MNQIIAKIAFSLTDKIVDGFIVDPKKLDKETVINDSDFESRLVDFLDEHIDIPFVSDELNRDAIESVLTVVKSIILMKI